MATNPPPPPGFFEVGGEPPLPPGFSEVGASAPEPAPPPGFREVQQRPAPASRQRPVAGDLGAISTPVDGDTFRLTGGKSLRLFGADAPEMRQPGYDRDGNRVTIGDMSRDYMANLLASAPTSIGDVQSMSYGRPVAPVTIGGLLGLGGTDAGEAAIRSGNALAAPRYLSGDPERRFDYLQAERLARANQLGPMNDYLTITPEQFRKNPDWVPERETVAQWFDTPTPYSGLTAEQEAEWLRLHREGTVADMLKFAEAHGFATDADTARQWVEYRDAETAAGRGVSPTMNYDLSRLNGSPVLTDDGRGQLGAAVRQGVQGFMAGGLDEGGAFFDMLGATPGRANIWNSDERLADLWARNRAQNASLLGFDEASYPTTSTVSQLGGALLQPFPGGKYNSFRRLAGWGGAYAGAEGFLGTEGDLRERTLGALMQAPVGVAVGGLGGKALEAATPYVARALGSTGETVRDLLRRGSTVADNAEPPPPTGFQPVEVDAPSTAPKAGWDEFRREGSERFLLYTTPDGQQANVHLDIGPDGMADISVDPFAAEANRFGPGTIREAARDLQKLYPEIKGFRGERQSGANPGRMQTIAMDAEAMPSVSAPARIKDYIDTGLPFRPQPVDAPLSEAMLRAASQNIGPRDVLPMPSNQVADVMEAASIDAGRITPARPVDERTELTRQSIFNWRGEPVPKVGPVDMVGYLRTRGGLVDQGGELRHMGLTNAARQGLDHVGQETRFGPLVNNDGGLKLDEAADAAWRAGYFPDHAERPTVSEFLDALRETYEGGAGRRFLADDMPEVERFDAARIERLDLEKRIAEGEPVYRDRSAPADEPQPLPPVEAYEDWGPKAPDFAGNINLGKLDTPQDIARALSQTNNRVGGFDNATRGRISQAETERLASELGMTADKLLSRRAGQAFNAEEALAARQILAKSGNELVNAARSIQRLEDPGDELLAAFREKWLRHVAIQEQVAGMTAEAGRALQQFRQLADSRLVNGDVLSAFVSGGGGKKNLKEAAETLLEAVETSPGKFNAKAVQGLKPSLTNKINEYYVNALLSGPRTHVVNMVSNTLTALAQIPEYAAGATIGSLRRMAGRSDAGDVITGTEVGARAFGLLQGAKEGARLFARALKTGEPSDFISKVEGQEYEAIPGVLGKIVRTPTRFLTAEDELFKGIARRMALNGMAVRKAHGEGLKGKALSERVAELLAAPTEEMLEEAFDYGRYLTFQTPLTRGSWASDMASAVSRATNQSAPLKTFLPFIRTPTNLMKFAVERSPAAPLLSRWRADIAAGGARRDLAMARAAVGTGFGFAIYEYALRGNITSSAPTDPAKKRLFYADGKQPYSIKIGDTWYSYARLDPFATTLGVAADLATKSDGMTEKEREEGAGLLVASITGNLSDKTWLSGLSDVVAALDEPGRYVDNLARRVVGSYAIPSIVAQAAGALDPVRREADTLGEHLRSRIPGLSQTLLPRRGLWGDPITNESLGPDFLSPVWTSRDKSDPVNEALGSFGYAPGTPSRKVGGETLSDEVFDQYRAVAGQSAYVKLGDLINSPSWQGMSQERREKAAKKVVAREYKRARQDLGIEGGRGASVPDGPSVPASGPPPAAPAGFFEVDERGERQIMSEIEAAIPGVQFTSGFRTPAYQADMLRRGYKPAKNSAHLRGDGLDMLPPPGKSLGWLRDQFREAFPGARLLVHDGHLHATLDGWGNAPALGGAVSAGIRNPREPAPPAGFYAVR